MTGLSSWRKMADAALSRYREAKRRVEREEASLSKSDKRIEAIEQLQEIAQAVAQRIQMQAHRKIAEVVSRCLQVFPDPYEFAIEFERKRGKTEARLLFIRDGLEVDDPLDQAGGGVGDVASFALRVACLVLSRPPLRRLLVLDEPFRFLRRSRHAQMSALLQALATELDIQFVIVTHDAGLRSGTVFSLD